MDQIRSAGRSSTANRWRKFSLTKKGERALNTLLPQTAASAMQAAHDDSEALRRFAQLMNRKRGKKADSEARFELDPETGLVVVSLYDAETGAFEIRLTPDEVAAGLKELEESDDAEPHMTSFFVDRRV